MNPCSSARLAAVFAVALLATPASAQTPVSTCGTTVDDGILVADLDCIGVTAPGVAVENYGSLNLNGFTITGGVNAVQCNGKCTVSGPGTVRDAEYDGVVGVYGTVTVASIAALDNGAVGIASKTVYLQDSTVSGNRIAGVLALKRAFVSSSNLVGTGAFGVNSYRRAALTNCDVSNNEYGVAGVNVSVSGSTANNNEEFGISGRGVRIENTTATGNGSACDSDGCGDVRATRVRATGLTCETSIELDWPGGTPTGANLGICAND